MDGLLTSRPIEELLLVRCDPLSVPGLQTKGPESIKRVLVGKAQLG